MQDGGESGVVADSSDPKGKTSSDNGGDHSKIEMDNDKLQALVDSFPTDLAMEAMVEAEKLLNQKDVKCHACGAAATFFCFQCSDVLCAQCIAIHSKLKVSRHHVLEEMSSLTADRLAEFQRPNPCSQHPEEPCRFFCPQHNTSLCLLCATSRHRRCHEMKELQQRAEEARALLGQLIQELSGGVAELDRALAELEDHLTQTKAQAETDLTQIRTLRTRLHAAVDHCCDRLELKVSETREGICDSVAKAKVILLSRKSRLELHKTVGERAHESKAHDVVCDMTSLLTPRLKDLDRRVSLPETFEEVTTATLIVDENTVCRVEQQLAKLGEVKVEWAKVTANTDPFKFHDRHGSHIVLIGDKKTAERTQGCNNGVVVVRLPMAVGELTEVLIDKYDTSCGSGFTGDLVVGVSTRSPDVVDIRPWAHKMQSTIVICNQGTYISGTPQVQLQEVYYEEHQYRRSDYRRGDLCEKNQNLYQTVGQHLNGLQAGNRVGVCLDSSHSLHLYVNGQDRGVFAVNVPQPCYALFDVCDYIWKVTLQPLKKVSV